MEQLMKDTVDTLKEEKWINGLNHVLRRRQR